MSLENTSPKSDKESQERIVAAAVQYRGEVVTAPSHVQAFENLLEKHPDATNHDAEVQDGYVTSSGRFVMRGEATEIARTSGQFPKNDDPDLYFDSSFIKGQGK